MNYELFMGEALAEAQLALARGERPNAAVAVVDEAMVARAHDRVQETNDPTAHAVIVALRETARKLGSVRLADATIFTTQEPCAMCVGALLESDVEALVYAVANDRDGAAGTVIQLAQHPALPRRIKVVSGIRRDEAEALFGRSPRLTDADEGLAGRDAAVWYPLPRRGVRVVDGAALEKRCAKAPRVRIPPSPPALIGRGTAPWLAWSPALLAHAPSGARVSGYGRRGSTRHVSRDAGSSISAGRRGQSGLASARVAGAARTSDDDGARLRPTRGHTRCRNAVRAQPVAGSKSRSLSVSTQDADRSPRPSPDGGRTDTAVSITPCR